MTGSALFRFQAGIDVGLGHAMRCATLADALTDEGWTCMLAGNPGSRVLLSGIRNVRHNFVEDANFDVPEALHARFPGGCDLAIVDHYGLGADYEIKLKGWAKTVLAIDDLADRRHAVDVLLDQTLGREPADYASLIPENAKLLLGSAYALLRPQFRERRAEALARRRADRPIRRIAVSLGGAPPASLLERIVAEISEALSDRDLDKIEIEVVAGASAEQTPALQRDYVSVRPANEICEALVLADLAVGAAGTSSWERCCLGLPTIMVQLADNQALIAQRLHEAGAALDLGPAENIEPGGLARALRRLVEDGAARERMAHAAARVCDGLGAQRVAKALAR